jgi:predicted nucleic acid-binding protein
VTAARLVVDTNVVVSGLITADPRAATAEVLDGMLAARFRYLVSAELTQLALNAAVREPPPFPGPVPDAGDRHLWALVASDPAAAVLVTGDRALRRGSAEPERVLSPRQALSLLSGHPA